MKQFKPFDKVLFRYENSIWYPSFYQGNNNTEHYVIGLNDTIEDHNILPYEGNEHLVGTCDEPEKEITLKEGEYYWFTNDSGMSYPELWKLRKLEKIQSNNFLIYDDYAEDNFIYYNAIKQSDFNPHNMFESQKHMIRVKNGKLVKVNK